MADPLAAMLTHITNGRKDVGSDQMWIINGLYCGSIDRIPSLYHYYTVSFKIYTINFIHQYFKYCCRSRTGSAPYGNIFLIRRPKYVILKILKKGSLIAFWVHFPSCDGGTKLLPCVCNNIWQGQNVITQSGSLTIRHWGFSHWLSLDSNGPELSH